MGLPIDIGYMPIFPNSMDERWTIADDPIMLEKQEGRIWQTFEN